jgi:hypothetical protein
MLLPSRINVVTGMPEEMAEAGTLNYYCSPMYQYNVETGEWKEVVDYTRLVRDWLNGCTHENVLPYAGWNTSEVRGFQNVTSKRFYMREADLDKMYVLGYNPIYDMAGRGPIIYGNRIAGDTYLTIADIICTVDIFVKLDSYLKKENAYSTSYRITDVLRSMEYGHKIMNWGVTAYSDDSINVAFATSINKERVSLTASKNEWCLSWENRYRMDTICRLYPEVFKQRSSDSWSYGDLVIGIM